MGKMAHLPFPQCLQLACYRSLWLLVACLAPSCKNMELYSPGSLCQIQDVPFFLLQVYDSEKKTNFKVEKNQHSVALTSIYLEEKTPASVWWYHWRSRYQSNIISRWNITLIFCLFLQSKSKFLWWALAKNCIRLQIYVTFFCLGW